MISVIIPVYNGENYVEQIYESFTNQTYTNFELIFINDGSTDGSLNKIKQLSINENFRIKYINQTNSGVSAARNAGLRKAEGDYICFCDVDDTVNKTYLEDMYFLLTRGNTDLVIARDQLNREGKIRPEQHTGNCYIMPAAMALEKYLYGILDTTCCATMVKREFLLKNNLQFADGYKYGEDVHMLWRMIACSTNVAYIDKPLYIYHLQAGSAMSAFNSDRFHAYFLTKELEDLMQKRHPVFFDTFKKYAANKILWSITWQWATQITNKEFRNFIKRNNVKKSMYDLLTFKNKKVALSSFICLISPTVFRKMAIFIGKRYMA
ncbi:MAG TPA: glycosyltransferase [Pseudogracilibacillus sp.]|nr:glycosyltransferase [Pseudogracilibacillus sp.]